MVAASFVLGSSVIPALPVASAAAAESADCGMLAVGEPCTFGYDQHPGETDVTIPPNVDFVTVVLNGASGGGATDGQGKAGLGGSAIGVIDVRLPEDRQLTVWLGQEGNGLDGTSNGWSRGGRGGRSHTDGGAGGGSSAVAYSIQVDNVLMVAGGGGGGGAETGAYMNDGGDGGSGGNPAQNGTRGKSVSNSVWGPGGKGGGEGASDGGHGEDYTQDLGAGGGGGGGGFPGGSGGKNGEIAFHQLEGSGGGGGGGASYLDDELHDQLGYGLAPFGDGSITIYPSQPLPRFECTDTHDPITIDIPSDVTGYAFVLEGGAGEHGSNVAPEGSGAFVTGVLDVDGLTQLNYWVGCSGYDHEGAGLGHPGAGGHAPDGGNDGGRGGGASALATTDGQMLVVAGGGGGAGGDMGSCETYPGAECGGAGGSGGGSSHSRSPAHGQEGGDGVAGGGDGGCTNCHHDGGQRSIDGGHGVEPPDTELDTGGGGGGGAGYPAGGNGGHHEDGAPGGGGGAGGSHLSSRVTTGSISPSGHLGSGYVLLIPIVERRTDLTIEVTASGPAAAYAAAPFTIATHCTLGGQTVLEHTVSLKAGGSHVFTDVPQDARCTVTETGHGGASTPAPEQTFTLGEVPKTVTLDNVFAAGDLSLGVTSAIVDEAGDPVTGVELTLPDLYAQVECSIAGHPLTLADDGRYVVPGQDTWGTGWTAEIEGLPVGGACAIRETGTGGATSVEYSADGGAPEPLPGETLIAATGSSLAVINHFATGSLEVGKTADGSGTPPDSVSYPGTVACTFGGEPVVFTPALNSFANAVGATTTYSDVPLGADCTITETDRGIAQAVTYLPASTVRVDSDLTVDATVRNTFEEGTFFIEVVREGDGAHWANGGYTVHVECDDGYIADHQLNDTGGYLGIPADVGATCTVEETVVGGATIVTSVTSQDPTPVAGPVNVVIPATGAATVTITNTFLAAPIHLDATMSGPGARFSDGAIIDVEACTFDGIPFDIADNGQFSYITHRAGGHAVTPPVPVGALCNVRIGDNAGGVPTVVPVNADPVTVVNDATIQITVQDELTGPTTVETDFFFALAALDVSMVITGAGAEFANAPYEVEISCTIDGDPLIDFGTNSTVTIHFGVDGSLIPDPASAALASLPVGADCGGIETVRGGASEVGVNPPGTSIDPDGSTIIVTNVFDLAPLSVTALVDGNDQAAHADAEFDFDAACTLNGLPLLITPTTPVTFALGAGDVRDILMPFNTQCTITETFDEHATSVSPDRVQTADLSQGPVALTFTNAFDVDEVTVQQAVSGEGRDTYGMDVVYVVDLDCTWPSDGERIELPNNGKVPLDAAGFFTATVPVPIGATCGAMEPFGLASELVAPAPITVALGGEFVLVIEAVYDVGDLSVQKDARGQYSAALQFGFETTCTFQTDEGAVDIPLNDFADEEYALGDGEVQLIEVLHGADCRTTEVAAHDPLRVAVEVTGFGATTSGDRTAQSVVLDGVPSTVLVTNFFVGSLPLTGSELSLTGLWVALALLLSGGAVIVVRLIRRRNPIPPTQ